MAPIKRKASHEPLTQEPKRSKLSSQDRSKLTTISSEGDAFRRGGADILTPLERRQIRTKAEQDALLEQKPDLQRSKLLEYGDDGSIRDSYEEPFTTRADQRNRRRRLGKDASRSKGASATKKPSVHVEGLSYKRLVPGFAVLGQISSIGPKDITLSLPNNLVGFIPRHSISQGIDHLSHSHDEDFSLEENDQRKNSTSIPNIEDYFFIGQYLRAIVTSNTHSAGSHAIGKKHIELSILPKQTNIGLTTGNITPNTTLQAEVVSVEDHGLMMNIGLDETSVKGFVSTKDLGSGNELSKVKPGAVRLCLVVGVDDPKSRFVKLSLDTDRLANLQESLLTKNISTVDTLLPGALVEFTLAEITPLGLLGDLMGLVEVTADLVHSGVLQDDVPSDQKYCKGMKLKARTIWTLPSAETRTIGVSVLGHVLALSRSQLPGPKTNATPLDMLPISTIKDDLKVQKVQPGIGLLVNVGVPNIFGFAHISRLSDDKIQDISAESGRFAIGSLHQGRVVGYNPIDGLFSLSLEPKIIGLPFLYLDDVLPGQKVKATIEKLLIRPGEARKVIVRLTDTITGFVPDSHFADVPLHVPERKFKLGSKVTTRVLSVDMIRRCVRLTCKKTLLNSDSPVWKTYSDLCPGIKSYGTIRSLKSSGAVLEFYGPVKGFLPVSEMSESFVRDPMEHFQVGQVLSVRVNSVDVARERLTLSCREVSSSEDAGSRALGNIKVGSIVVGKVAEKLPNDLILEVEGTNTRAILPFGHLLDASYQDCLTAAKRLRVGQTLQNVMVIGTGQNRRQLKTTRKPSISRAMEAGWALPTSFEDISLGKNVVGYVGNIKSGVGVFVHFANSLTGLLLPSQIPDDRVEFEDYGLERDQIIHARVISIDPDQQRFLLTQKKPSVLDTKASNPEPNSGKTQGLINAVDGVSQTLEDFVLGKVTKARIKSVKATQLNVELADGVPGRVDASQAFTSWENSLKDRKRPLMSSFKTGQVLSVRILGIHDSKSHRYLPITHTRTNPVFELSAKQEAHVSVIPTLDQVQEGSSWLCFVNNIARDYLWVNLGPNLRGRIHALDVSDDPSVLNNLMEHFPVGSAIRATVLNVDLTKSRLDLTGRFDNKIAPRDPIEFKKGAKVPGKVVDCTDMLVKVQLSVMAFGFIHRTDMVDDFSEADVTLYKENSYLTASVIGFEKEKNSLFLSSRPSRITSSPSPIIDQEIESIEQIHIDQTLRGFIKNVTDKGIFVSLSRRLTAFVRVSDLSDSFLKHWQDHPNFKQGQLIKGKIVDIDLTLGQVRMSLKESIMDKEYRVPIKWNDLREGELHTGKVRKVETFGVFVVFDNSLNVSGLCHRSEIADDPVADARPFYQEGDPVKVKILRVDQGTRRVSLGMKTSYLEPSTNHKDEYTRASNSSDSGSESGTQDLIEGSNAEPFLESGVVYTTNAEQSVELDIGDFEWTDTLDLQANDNGAPSWHQDLGEGLPNKRGSALEAKATVGVDSQDGLSSSHLEKLVLNQPGSSLLWLNYMSFHLQLGELVKAREVAERAVRTVTSHSGNNGEETLNVWVGYLNLEHAYGDETTLERVFERACQYNDQKEVHHRLASTYIQSGAHQNADKILQSMVKRFSDDPKVWHNFASFLFDVVQAPDRGRELLSRALQSLSRVHHVQVTSKFAQLEFKSSHGDRERGRTMFEGLFASFPQRLDLWSVLIDLEATRGSKDQVRKLYERVTSGKLKVQKARFFFKKWLEFEEREGNLQNIEKVKAKAARYVENREAAQDQDQKVLKPT